MSFVADIYESDENRRLKRCESLTCNCEVESGDNGVVVTLDPQDRHQRIIGFGGAITDAVAINYQRLSAQQREQFLEWYFSPKGAGYTLCRIPIQGCDFSEGPFTYARRPWDRELKHFSLDHDRRLILPVIKDALRHAKMRGLDVQFMATPWSPPWYLKTNLFPRFGGRLRKGSYRRWAKMIARFAKEFREEGVPITRISIQNEPEARQLWESCLMTGEQEAFLALCVREALDAEGLGGIKLLAWDHNKDRLPDRIEETLAVSGVENVIDGVAFHWYAGYLFENVEKTAQLWPDLELIASESAEDYCEIGNEPLRHGENYAYDIIGDLNAGAHAWIDWNMLLNDQGGPTYVKNYCAAPLRFDRASKTLHVMRSAAYLAHFSRFIKPNAYRIGLACAGLPTDATAITNPEGNFAGVSTTAAQNPDGSIVCVVLNSGDDACSLCIQVAGEAQQVSHCVRAHSIATFVLGTN